MTRLYEYDHTRYRVRLDPGSNATAVAAYAFDGDTAVIVACAGGAHLGGGVYQRSALRWWLVRREGHRLSVLDSGSLDGDYTGLGQAMIGAGPNRAAIIASRLSDSGNGVDSLDVVTVTRTGDSAAVTAVTVVDRALESLALVEQNAAVGYVGGRLLALFSARVTSDSLWKGYGRWVDGGPRFEWFDGTRPDPNEYDTHLQGVWAIATLSASKIVVFMQTSKASPGAESPAEVVTVNGDELIRSGLPTNIQGFFNVHAQRGWLEHVEGDYVFRSYQFSDAILGMRVAVQVLLRQSDDSLRVVASQLARTGNVNAGNITHLATRLFPPHPARGGTRPPRALYAGGGRGGEAWVTHLTQWDLSGVSPSGGLDTDLPLVKYASGSALDGDNWSLYGTQARIESDDDRTDRPTVDPYESEALPAVGLAVFDHEWFLVAHRWNINAGVVGVSEGAQQPPDPVLYAEVYKLHDPLAYAEVVGRDHLRTRVHTIEHRLRRT